MADDAVEAEWGTADGDRAASVAGEDGVSGVPVAPMVGDVGDDQVSFLTEQLTRVLSERSSRSGGRTVIVVPIDQKTLDAGRVVFEDRLEAEMALFVAKSVGAWKAVQDRRHGLIDQHGRKTS